MRTKRHWLGALCVLLLSGCAATGQHVRAPDVRLAAVDVVSLSFSKQTFRLSFEVSNPNLFPLPVRGIRYLVMLEQQRFAGGESAGRFTIPANGEGEFAIGVELDLMDSAAQLASIIASGIARPLEYELHGSLEVALPFARPINFASSGTIMLHGNRR